MVNVKIIYSAELAPLAGTHSDTLQIEKPMVTDLIATLRTRHGIAFGDVLQAADIWVNGVNATGDTVLNEGDVVVVRLVLEGG